MSLAEKPIEWSGDFRYRHEWVSQEVTSATAISSYQQERIRGRLGARGWVNPNTTIETRLSTQPGRVSTNQTLGGSANAFGNYTITLDRMGFRYQPSDLGVFSGGRIANPYFVPGGSDLVWDTDLNFDGLAMSLTPWPDADLLPFLNVGGFWVDKQTTVSTTAKDVLLASVQMGLRHTTNQGVSWIVGVSDYHYTSAAGHAIFSTPTAPSGNSTTTVGATSVYVTDFNLISGGVELGTPISGVPVSSYDYRKVQQDAAVAAFTDGDCFGGGTNGKSHRLTVGMQLASRWSGQLTGYLGSAGIASGQTAVRRNKVHADLNFAF